MSAARTIGALRVPWVVVPLAFLAVAYAVMLAEGHGVEQEIHLVAPVEVRPGDPIPLRAFLFDGVHRVEGPELSVEPELEVGLYDGERELSRVRLAAGTRSYEGRLEAPDAEGPLELRARARIDGDVVATVRRALALREAARAAPLGGRVTSALAILELGALRVSGELPVPTLDVRVVGGACIPEEICTLLVQADDLELSTEPTAALEIASDARAVSPAIQRLDVIVHGPEALTELVVSRAGTEAARREMRFPVALATPWLDVAEAADSGVVEAALHPPPGRDDAVVDAYLEGRWMATGTMRGDETRLPFPLDRPGLWRLQAHADPFSADHAAARHVRIGGELDVAPALAAEGLPVTTLPGAPAAYALAAAEEDLRALPDGNSGLDADVARVEAVRGRVRVFGAVVLLVGLALLAGAIFYRGMAADALARDVMAAAGDAEARSARARWRGTLAVAIFVGAVVLAFLAGATVLFARAVLG